VAGVGGAVVPGAGGGLVPGEEGASEGGGGEPGEPTGSPEGELASASAVAGAPRPASNAAGATVEVDHSREVAITARAARRA
jgi:hypothetical protein